MSSIFQTTPFLPLFSLLGSLFLTICNTALLRLGRFKSKELLQRSHLFFFHRCLKRFFPRGEWENLYFSISLSKQIYQLAYAISAFLYLLFIFPPAKGTWEPLLLATAIIALFLFLDFLLRLLTSLWSRSFLKATALFSSFCLLLLFPLVGLLLKVTRSFLHKIPFSEEELVADKAKLREIIRESELQHHLEPADQKLINSFVNFKDRVAKEIMVPRIDLFSLAAQISIREAAPLFAEEGYSRIPIFRESLDQIVGVVLYKDLLKYYATPGSDLNAPLETLAKPVLYTPENKKIALLLQEFRNKQIHMAIVVDEYGGTEGIVTIEDILEELVGEIEDEYDIGEETPFWELPGGGWVVDAKMTLLDIEERLGIRIPTSPEYETLGGYIYHTAGTIPVKGWRLSHDEFDLEVLSSNERGIKKVKIVPRTP